MNLDIILVNSTGCDTADNFLPDILVINASLMFAISGIWLFLRIDPAIELPPKVIVLINWGRFLTFATDAVL